METDIIGQTIVAIRPMSKSEMEAEGWTESKMDGKPFVLVLSSGFLIYPSQDPEGNGAGTLFGNNPKTKESFYVGM